MVSVINKPYWSDKFETRMSEADMPNAIQTLITTISSFSHSFDVLNCECPLKEVNSSVHVSIRNNYNGKFSDELLKKGFVDVQTAKGMKRKYHIKVSSDLKEGAQMLGMFLLFQLNVRGVIQHQQASLVGKAKQDRPKSKSPMTIEFETTPEGMKLKKVHI